MPGADISDAAGPKALDLGPKFVSAERALAAIRAGSRIYVGLDAPPPSLLAKLEAMDPGPRTSSSSASSQRQRCRRWRRFATRYRHRAFFVGSEVRGLAASGQLDYVPISLEEVPGLLTSGRLPIDVALLQVSPPDAGASSASACP